VILPAIPDRALTELGRTEGGPDTLALLVRDQDTRRLLVVRAVLDAVEGADDAVCPPRARARMREDWALLVEADRTEPPGGYGPAPEEAGSVPAPGPVSFPHGVSVPRRSPARDRLLHPLIGPWARRCLRGLDTEPGPPTEEGARELARDLAHFSAVAAVAAARAGISFSVRLRGRDGVLALPSLGALYTVQSGDAVVEVIHRQGRLTMRQRGVPDIVVHPESGLGAWSGSLAWTPAYALPSLLPGASPMPLDDIDPYRTVHGGRRHHALSMPATLDDGERKRWTQAWAGTADALAMGGEGRVGEAVSLLRCLVPLAAPPGATAAGQTSGSLSATRREAFGALLSSTPPTPMVFAATLVHELNHAKLSAVSDMVALHQADRKEAYFAPWRPDPRPYNGLLQGAYAHLALAVFHQRCALAAVHPADRESAWALHARYRTQVGAVLPAIVGSPELTAVGRRFVDDMIATHERMAGQPVPQGHVVRAQAYVEAARALWMQRHAPRLSDAE
jgi:HEXXH motif-containing protein